MPVGRKEMISGTLPSPFPEGWYFVASRKALSKAQLIEKTWMGEDIVVFANNKDEVCVAKAYCPHLGSHLGPTTGGCVKDGRLVCPFHGFAYNTKGDCVATPFAPPPEGMRLETFPSVEMSGLIFAWWGIDGRPPQWHLPHIPEEDKWSEQRIWTTRFAGHPQETTENAVDLAHLRYIHGYHNVSREEKITIDGHRFESNFNFSTTRKLAGIPFASLDLTAHTNIYGLGYSFVRVREHSVGMDLRMWVLATPIDGTNIDMSVVSSTAEIAEPKRFVIGLGFLPRALRARTLNRIVLFLQSRDVLQDVVIWGRKLTRMKPVLSRSDGEIMAYRAYCRQFYEAEVQADGQTDSQADPQADPQADKRNEQQAESATP